MKKLFKNYTYEFDKNERKIIINFCKQAIKQLDGDKQYFADVNSFKSIMNKVNDSSDEIKLTKDESRRLSVQLKENIKHIEKQMKNSWFLKKWLYKTVFNQYKSLLEDHFSN
ncbi:MAG: hypothetical protein KKA84_09470 [Bacteroidetes bacterium]|nr:hypothetical protein [Bacteroidota bacterium]